MGNWREVVAEQVEVFRRVGLDPVTVAVGAQRWDVAHLTAEMGLRVVESHTNLDAYETPTLQRLWQWAQQNPGGAVLYCHTKGVSAPNDARKQAWRQLMMRAVVERWRDNLTMLDRYDAVGVDWLDNKHYPRFSGNFWMATTNWINLLQPPNTHRQSSSGTDLYSNPWERIHAEMWLGSLPQCRALSLVCRNTLLVSGYAAFDLVRYDSPYGTLFDASFDRVSDRTDKSSVHSYIPFYAHIFTTIVEQPIRLLEIGVLDGGSLDAWANIFTHREARIYGVDKRLLASYSPCDSRIALIEADATQPGTWINDVAACDVVIDDGSHAIEDQIAAFRILWPLVRPGGYYVIEDVQSDEAARRLHAVIPHAREEDLRRVKSRYDDRIIWAQKSLQA